MRIGGGMFPPHTEDRDACPPEGLARPWLGRCHGLGGRAGMRWVASDDHVHEDCPLDRRLWLEQDPEQASKMRLHPYCVGCGVVRVMGTARAKAMGFYHGALSHLKAYLERSVESPKLTQVQTHLITVKLEEIGGFADAYSLGFRRQLSMFVEAVRSVRPDLEEELVTRMLPRERREPKKSYIQLLEERERGIGEAPGVPTASS